MLSLSRISNMTDQQITQALVARSPLPTVYAVISEFHCGYQKALRCLEAAGAVRRINHPFFAGPEPEHDLIETGDADSGSWIEDGHGEVVLAYCRVCRRGEVNLEKTCPGAAGEKVWTMEDF